MHRKNVYIYILYYYIHIHVCICVCIYLYLYLYLYTSTNAKYPQWVCKDYDINIKHDGKQREINRQYLLSIYLSISAVENSAEEGSREYILITFYK